jgi:urea transport system permease protein
MACDRPAVRVFSCLLHALLIAFIAVTPLASANEPLDDAQFGAVLEVLAGKKFSARTKAVAEIQASGHRQAAAVLNAALEGRLFRLKSDRRLVIAAEPDDTDELRIVDAISGDGAASTKKGALRKVRTNNRLRKLLRGALAGLRLVDPNPQLRLEAAQELLGTPSAESAKLLRDALGNEIDDNVREAMQIGLASIDIASGNPRQRLQAIDMLRDSLRQEVRALLEKTSNDESAQTEVRTAARQALADIEARLSVYEQVNNLYFGISLGSVLLLAAIGLAITFGVMGVINMAHGEMVMLGAYTTYVVQQLLPAHIEWSLLIALPAAFLVAATVGIAIERGVIRFLYGRPLETLLATFGVSLILQQAVRSIFTPLNRSVITPQWMSGTLEINPALALTYNRLYIIAFSLIVLLALVMLLRYSRFGLEVRAVTQNRAMASAMGIRTARVDAMTFGLGSGIAGLAGVALSQLTNVGPNMGQAYIVDSFMVVVFGGVGNLLGTFMGAMTLGIANKFLEPVAGAVLAKILVLIFIILFIQRRPRGLFAQSGRSAEL